MGVRIVLIGFPGVGKLTIAKELSAMVSAKIVDNHWVNNPILRLLDEDGTAPLPKGIWEFTGRFRQTVLDAITAYAPSANFIFTLPAWRVMSGAFVPFNRSPVLPKPATPFWCRCVCCVMKRI